MNVSIIQIGNSKGIRLGKAILEKYEINDSVELVLEKDHILIKPIHTPRKGWEKSFKKMHEKGDDKILIDDFFEDENLEEWT
jgi:antitoxin MazE